MIIKKIDIENFGKFSDRHFEFENGLNMIYGDNEHGKSTLMAFIKMIFYSKCGSEKSADLLKNPRRRYMPWNGAPMAGSVTFEKDGCKYTVRKEFKRTAASDICEVYNASRGARIDLAPGEEVGEHFFGITLGEFERSMFIDRTGGFSADSSDYGMATKIANLSGSGDENISPQTVLRRLTAAAEELISKNGKKGLIIDADAELGNLRAMRHSLAEHYREQEALAAEINELETKAAKLESEFANMHAAADTEPLKKELNAYKMLRSKLAALRSAENKLSSSGTDIEKISAAIAQCRTLKDSIAAADAAVHSEKSGSANRSEEYEDFAALLAELDAAEKDLEIINTKILPAQVMCETEERLARLKIKKRGKIYLAAAIISAAVSAALGFTLGTAFYYGFIISAIAAVMFVTALYRAAGDKVVSYKLHTAQNELKNASAQLSVNHSGLSFESVEYDLRKRTLEIHEYIDELKKKYKCETADEILSALRGGTESFDSSAVQKASRLREKFISVISTVSPAANFSDALAAYSEAVRLLGEIRTLVRDSQTIMQTADIKNLSFPEMDKKISELELLLSAQNKTASACTEHTEELQKVRQKLRNCYGRVRSTDLDMKTLNLQIKEKKEELARLKLRHSALCAAIETMNDAIRDTDQSIGTVLRTKTREYLKAMTDGRYDDVLISKNLNVEARQNGEQTFRQWKYMSSAAADRTYLALRLAAADIICNGNAVFPLFLDDILSQYDSDSCRRTMLCLQNRGGQILFFTCHKHITNLAREIVPELYEFSL